MEEFNFVSNRLQQLESLKDLLSEGTKYMPDLNVYRDKIDSIESTIKSQEISIVLLGSFSDGKTSAIAGLLGRLEDNMKIDNDESSDELTVYRPSDLKKGFKIIDTPGLFGTKEREIDGRQVKFSQITERYISEAHILIYVCDAVVPLKDSHVEVLRRILRDYGKLDNTVFVINKMDEAGYDLLDESDFSNGCRIKRENLIERLRNTIGLTPDEENRLRVVCIAADPKGKGLKYWFTKIDDYYNRSHINDLRKNVNEIVEQTESSELLNSAAIASINDVLNGLGDAIDQTSIPISRALAQIKRDIPEIEEDRQQLKNELTISKNQLRDAINNIKNDALIEIRGASMETLDDVISCQLGEQDGKVSFYVFLDKLNSQTEQCCEANTSSIDAAAVNLGKKFERQEKMLGEAVKYGAERLKNVNISGEQVKAIRDVIAKNHKFKPWGAIKLGENLTKYMKRVASVLTVGLEIYGWIKSHKEQKKFEETKQLLINAVNDIVASIFESIKSDEEYYKNYAPSYLELCNRIEERDIEINTLEKQMQDLESYRNNIDNWKKSAELL